MWQISLYKPPWNPLPHQGYSNRRIRAQPQGFISENHLSLLAASETATERAAPISSRHAYTSLSNNVHCPIIFQQNEKVVHMKNKLRTKQEPPMLSTHPRKHTRLFALLKLQYFSTILQISICPVSTASSEAEVKTKILLTLRKPH